MVDVSIIIPTKNGGELFKKALRMIFAQKYPPGEFEVIVIDSGSKDQTVDLANIYDARIINIKPEDFGHGKTRNLGAKLAKGKYLVFTTQDAVPVTENWLFNLVRNLEAPQVAELFRIHGLPTSIVSDRDVRFCGYFWRHIFDKLHVTLNMSSGDHPQTDGQTERVNQVLKDMLHAYVSNRKTNWNLCLPLLEFAFNKCPHK